MIHYDHNYSKQDLQISHSSSNKGLLEAVPSTSKRRLVEHCTTVGQQNISSEETTPQRKPCISEGQKNVKRKLIDNSTAECQHSISSEMNTALKTGAVVRRVSSIFGNTNNPFRCITNKIEDVPTHTGQKWDSDDYRLARFTLAAKQVNPNWAVKLIEEIPPREVTDRVVWCDGGSGPEGHPRVYINLDKPGNHSCGYCGLRFVKKDHH